MIQMPRRSVTRFFIPMIDVLTLLFCIFLLLPLVKNTNDPTIGDELQARDDKIRQLELEKDRLSTQGNDLPQNLRDELEALRKERMTVLQDRLAIRVLEIDSRTGGLYYRDPDRVEIRTQADAQDLIARDRADKKKHGRELFYLILYPRERSSPYPHRGQREQYEHWLKEVAHGFDIPGAAPAPTKGGGS